MKKTILAFLVLCSFMACRKSNDPASDNIRSILKQNLSAADFDNVDFGTTVASISPSTHQQIVRVGFKSTNILHDFVIMSLSSTAKLSDAKIVHIEGSAIKTGTTAKVSFNGSIETSSLQRKNKQVSAITNGFVMALHTQTTTVNGVGVRTNFVCDDCTLPEVIVSSSPSSGGFDWTSWLNLLWMLSDAAPDNYIAIDYSSGGGGGGGSAPSPAPVTIDQETSENKTPIDLKKYLNCFGTIPDAGANCLITISTDIPMDGHPEQIFDWTQGNPGHAFIELYKLGNSGLISQNFGLYPSIGFLALTGLDVPSKVVDNAGHEYNARYTISVTPSQFQAAINTANNLGSQGYNISTFNCTDFALAVFNAAGGNLTIPQRQIPGFPNGTTGSNTPQGLYQQLDNMKAAGTSGIDVIGSKAYGGLSHGPCN